MPLASSERAQSEHHIIVSGLKTTYIILFLDLVTSSLVHSPLCDLEPVCCRGLCLLGVKN